MAVAVSKLRKVAIIGVDTIGGLHRASLVAGTCENFGALARDATLVASSITMPRTSTRSRLSELSSQRDFLSLQIGHHAG